MVYLFVSACNLQDLVILASGWSNTKLVKRLQAIRWNNDVKCASVSWIAPLHGRMGNYWTRKSAVKSQEGKFAKRKWYSASSLYRISCGHNLKFKRISTLWHGTPSTYLPTSLPPSRHTHTHIHTYTPAYAHRVALSHINILAWRCFIYWVAFALGWRSSFPLWLLGMPPAWLPDCCLPAWLLRRAWQLARSWGHDGCDVHHAGCGPWRGRGKLRSATRRIRNMSYKRATRIT